MGAAPALVPAVPVVITKLSRAWFGQGMPQACPLLPYFYEKYVYSETERERDLRMHMYITLHYLAYIDIFLCI